MSRGSRCFSIARKGFIKVYDVELICATVLIRSFPSRSHHASRRGSIADVVRLSYLQSRPEPPKYITEWCWMGVAVRRTILFAGSWSTVVDSRKWRVMSASAAGDIPTCRRKQCTPAQASKGALSNQDQRRDVKHRNILRQSRRRRSKSPSSWFQV